MDAEVLVVGGGPTGLMLAGELKLAGVDVRLVERRETQEVDGSRAGGLLCRTLEVLEQRGIADRFVSAGQAHPFVGFSPELALRVDDLPTRHNYTLALWQRDFERILADWVLGDLGVPIRRGREAQEVSQSEDGVRLKLATGEVLEAAYLVGCDGGRSVVRRAAGIAFEGQEATTSWMIAEVAMSGVPKLGFHRDAAGTHAIG